MGKRKRELVFISKDIILAQSRKEGSSGNTLQGVSILQNVVQVQCREGESQVISKSKLLLSGILSGFSVGGEEVQEIMPQPFSLTKTQ